MNKLLIYLFYWILLMLIINVTCVCLSGLGFCGAGRVRVSVLDPTNSKHTCFSITLSINYIIPWFTHYLSGVFLQVCGIPIETWQIVSWCTTSLFKFWLVFLILSHTLKNAHVPWQLHNFVHSPHKPDSNPCEFSQPISRVPCSERRS